jgi:16S rRNA (guanine1207-N2)-methyltransferase
MVDVNLRAMHLAEINAKENRCTGVSIFESNCYSNINSKYSCIVTNPPIRAGKKVVYDIVMNAKDHLEVDGKLFVVIRKEQGAKSLIKDLQENGYKVDILEKKSGFFILKCYL